LTRISAIDISHRKGALCEAMEITRLFPRVLITAALAAGNYTFAFASDDIAALRSRALEVFSPLPRKMPGAENDTRTQIRLGRKLYFDKRLSSDRTISCDTCHALGTAATYRGESLGDYRTQPSRLVRKNTDRNAPTVLNAGFHFAQFWDGRATNLESQARSPMLNPAEMGMPGETEILKRLRGSLNYRLRFEHAFPNTPDPITLDNVTRAIAAYERTLISHDSFDKFLKGNNFALSRTERKGLKLFLDTGCAKCHNGPGLGGNSFQKIGLKNSYANTNDIGRAKITGDESDRFKFKVPSLRNVALTAPYFHDGQIPTLAEAVKQMAHLQLDAELSRDDTDAIVAFLRSLSDRKRLLEPHQGLPAQQ
jgi:cytochrome c peroxidase